MIVCQLEMIMHLVDNAIKCTHPGGYATLQLAEGTHHTCLRLIDTDIGSPTGHLPHIFERFYRVDPTHSSLESDSSGPSLSIVHAHKGSITTESKPGSGSTFTVRLPLAESRTD